MSSMTSVMNATYGMIMLKRKQKKIKKTKKQKERKVTGLPRASERRHAAPRRRRMREAATRAPS